MAEPRDRRHVAADAGAEGRLRLIGLAGAVLAGGVALLTWSIARHGPQPHLIARRPAAVIRQDGREIALTNPETDYEREDMHLGDVGLVALGAFALLLAVPLIIWAFYPRAAGDVNRHLAINPPGPRLQLDDAADLRQFRSDVEARLGSYGWVDKKKGIVHIPIEQAMKNLAQSGIPGFPKAAP